MTYPLNITDGRCTEHSDCTTTTFSNEIGVVGVRHMHQWLDPQGLDVPDGRTVTDLVFGSWNVGLLFDYDEATGVGVFDPDASVLTASTALADIDPRTRLNDAVYFIANDHRTPNADGTFPKLCGEGKTLDDLATVLETGRT